MVLRRKKKTRKRKLKKRNKKALSYFVSVFCFFVVSAVLFFRKNVFDSKNPLVGSNNEIEAYPGSVEVFVIVQQPQSEMVSKLELIEQSKVEEVVVAKTEAVASTVGSQPKVEEVAVADLAALNEETASTVESIGHPKTEGALDDEETFEIVFGDPLCELNDNQNSEEVSAIDVRKEDPAVNVFSGFDEHVHGSTDEKFTLNRETEEEIYFELDIPESIVVSDYVEHQEMLQEVVHDQIGEERIVEPVVEREESQVDALERVEDLVVSEGQGLAYSEAAQVVENNTLDQMMDGQTVDAALQLESVSSKDGFFSRVYCQIVGLFSHQKQSSTSQNKSFFRRCVELLFKPSLKMSHKVVSQSLSNSSVSMTDPQEEIVVESDALDPVIEDQIVFDILSEPESFKQPDVAQVVESDAQVAQEQVVVNESEFLEQSEVAQVVESDAQVAQEQVVVNESESLEQSEVAQVVESDVQVAQEEVVVNESESLEQPDVAQVVESDVQVAQEQVVSNEAASFEQSEVSQEAMSDARATRPKNGLISRVWRKMVSFFCSQKDSSVTSQENETVVSDFKSNHLESIQKPEKTQVVDSSDVVSEMPVESIFVSDSTFENRVALQQNTLDGASDFEKGSSESVISDQQISRMSLSTASSRDVRSSDIAKYSVDYSKKEKKLRKWNPYPTPKRLTLSHIEGGGVGYPVGYSQLKLLFASEYKLDRVLPMIDLRGDYFDNTQYGASLGAGVRYLPEEFCALLGANVYYDFRHSFKGNYQQLGLGFELIGEHLEFRANGYIPLGPKERRTICVYDDYIGDYYAINTQYEFVAYNFNAEIGAFTTCQDFLFYVAGGPYFFSGHFNDSTSWGGRLRARVQFLDYVALEGSYSHDSIFHSIFQGEIILSLPFYQFANWKDKKAPCKITDRQIYQPVERFDVVPLHRRNCWISNF